ncbi:MAE_28990/MAE_18760 family HEPN-like nuclease [Actinoplanes sp. NPDC048796]|uniref:MAE_28990/MAE_18760 family HEPN-like nuclease n=1 Tax=Actinoplanes sp. NPDC048796 TaxID=3155640 RepID=UPI0033EC405C
MATISSAAQNISVQQERLVKRAQGLKRLIISVQTAVRGAPSSQALLLQEARAAAIVGIVAELESLTRTALTELHQHINDAGVPISTIAACLRQLAAHDEFESLRTLQDATKVWEKRAFATSMDRQQRGANLPLPRRGPLPPMDGRTPTPGLYSRIWAVYGLHREVFPVASWSASIQKLSGLRNDVAHGNLPIYQIFQQPAVDVPDIERYIDDVEAFASHFVATITDYIDTKLYLIR